MMGGHVAQDALERADFDGTVVGNDLVVLPPVWVVTRR